MMKEIPDFPNYFITENGEVWSAKRNIFLTPHNDRGYLTVNLSNNVIRQIKKIHRLVAEAFIPNPNNLPQINHKDEDKTNNCVNNLEWCDQAYNNSYGHRTKSFSQKIKCVETQKIYSSIREASRQTGISYSSISMASRGLRHTAGGYRWEIWADSDNG